MKTSKYPIAVVHCVDQAFYSGVYDPRTEKFTASEMCIAGHLIRKDDKTVVIALEYFNDNEVRYVSAIPMRDIISMEVLREQVKD